MIGGRQEGWVGWVERADGEGRLDKGTPLSKLSFPQGVGVARMSRGEKGRKGI